MDERRRAILQGIIDAADSTPEQKLRAIEVLNEAEPVHERRDLSHLSDQELVEGAQTVQEGASASSLA